MQRCIGLLLGVPLLVAGQTSTVLDGVASVRLDPALGSYEIVLGSFGGRFAGNLNSAIDNGRRSYGGDSLGLYEEYSFEYASGTRRGAIRLYHARPVVFFTDEYVTQQENRSAFPTFREYPGFPYHRAYKGIFAGVTFSELPGDSPWEFFDDQRRTLILSPILRPSVQRQWIGSSGEIVCGVDQRIGTIRAGSKFYTLLVFERGINAANDTWGEAMRAVAGKERPSSDADVTLRTIGYWTDNGGAYYYRTEPGKTFTETFVALRDEFSAKGVRLGYVQLDSWHYPKGEKKDWTDFSSGIWEYQAADELFPGGLRPLADALKLPLVLHARWIDKTSPYRTRFRMSGNVVLDPLYYEQLAQELRASNVAVYEQDWLGTEANTDFNLDDPRTFFTTMASKLKGFGIQYCMALPRQILKSVEFENVTSIRGSRDRLQPEAWPELHHASRLIRSAGKWPFADVLRSSEIDNLLVAILTAGPVGIGDRIGELNALNLQSAARRDGVLVKPDLPAVPTDDSVLAEAKGVQHPMVVATQTKFKGYEAWYVLAYSRGGGPATATFVPARLGASGRVFVLDYLNGSGSIWDASDEVPIVITDKAAYYIVCPILPANIALLGDLGHFVPLGRARISEVKSEPNTLTFKLSFADGETSRTVAGYSASKPLVTPLAGMVRESSYDPENHIFFATAAPGREGDAQLSVRVGDDAASANGSRSRSIRVRRVASPTPEGSSYPRR